MTTQQRICDVEKSWKKMASEPLTEQCGYRQQSIGGMCPTLVNVEHWLGISKPNGGVGVWVTVAKALPKSIANRYIKSKLNQQIK